MTQKFMGEGYSWFIANVESLEDSYKIGRVQIRCYNIHSSDKNLLPTESLLWAYPQQDITSAALNGVGTSPTGIKIGTTVVGFFADGPEEKQVPIITGTLAGKNDVSKLAQGVNTIVKNIIPGSNEPEASYASVYPNNKVIQTSSGIVVEYDDTPNSVRYHLYHPAGSYTEINNEGRRIDKVADDAFSIYVKDHNVYIQGNLTVNVQGDSVINILGDADIGVSGDTVAILGGDLDVEVNGDSNISVGGDLNLAVIGDVLAEVGGNFEADVQGTFIANSTGEMILSASKFTFNGDSQFNGKINATGDVVGNDISLDNHEHSGVTPGASDTGPPVA